MIQNEAIKNKLEFAVKPKSKPSEERFAQEVLFRGEKEGYWVVDRFTAGGTRSERTALGIDFEIQSQETGIVIKIEYKAHVNLILTPAQCLRFFSTCDFPKSKLRLCGIVPINNNNQYASRAFYWSPKFLRSLPSDSFKDLTRAQQYGIFPKEFYWRGLGPCMSQNRNYILYQLVSGKLGDHGAQYRHIPLKEAYNWLYERLIDTITGLEKEEQEYSIYNLDSTVSSEIKGIILKTFQNSYRPLYTNEFEPGIQSNSPYINYRSGKPFIFNTDLTNYIRLKLDELVTEGSKVVCFKIPDYRWLSYGLKKWANAYIPLTRQATIILDILKLAWGTKQSAKYTAEDIATSTNSNLHYLRYILKETHRELEQAGLILYTPRRGMFASEYVLTKKCQDYFEKESNFT